MAIKINQSAGISDPRAPRERAAVQPQASFARILNAQKGPMQSDALKALLDQVDQQAKRVSVSRTVRDLQLYKKYIQTFLQEAVRSGLSTTQAHSWQQGGMKQTLVQTVNQKLITLTNALLEKQKDEVDLLDQLDEIRGMLINLYV
jgi:uncharacterized protein YaaR (DUF327 family)